MDPSVSHDMMRRQAVALTVVMVSFVTTRLKRKMPDSETQPDPLAPIIREQNEQHRQWTLSLIYHSTDIECISMLRMSRAPFLHCALLLELGRWWLTGRVSQWRSKLPCFSMLLGTTRGLELYTILLGDLFKLSTSTFIKCCILLVSLGMKSSRHLAVAPTLRFLEVIGGIHTWR